MAEKDISTDDNEDLETSDLEIFLDALAEYHSEYTLQPGEFTVSMIMERADETVDRGRVLNDLHARVKRGELGSKRERVSGKSQFVFWQIKSTAE